MPLSDFYFSNSASCNITSVYLKFSSKLDQAEKTMDKKFQNGEIDDGIF